MAFKDNDDNSIDVFVCSFRGGPGPIVGASYTASMNQTGNNAYKNFTVLSRNAIPRILPHESMHILLDSGHRDGDPAIALFYRSLTPPGTGVAAPRWIGPFPDCGPGENDTNLLRQRAEALP